MSERTTLVIVLYTPAWKHLFAIRPRCYWQNQIFIFRPQRTAWDWNGYWKYCREVFREIFFTSSWQGCCYRWVSNHIVEVNVSLLCIIPQYVCVCFHSGLGSLKQMGSIKSNGKLNIIYYSSAVSTLFFCCLAEEIQKYFRK